MSIINVGATPGTFLAFLTLAAIVVAVLSTTFIKAIFFVKITPSDPTDTRFLTLGLWGTCVQNTGPLECESPKFGYTFDRSRLNIVVPDGVVIPTVGSALGYLAIVHIFAIFSLLVTLLLGIIAHIRAAKLLLGIASQISILSTGILLFSFIVDFIMFNNGVMTIINTINVNSQSANSYKATFGIAYWLVLISLIISVIAAIAFFLGRKYIIRKNFSIEDDESSDDITNTTMVSDPADRYDPFKKTTQQQPFYTTNNMVVNNDYDYDNDNRIVNNYPVDDENFAYDNLQKPYPPNYLQKPQQPINPETIEYSQQNNTNKHTSDTYSLDEFYTAPSNLQPHFQNSPHPPPMHNNNGFNNPPHSTQSSTSNIFYHSPSSPSSPHPPINQNAQLQQLPPPQLPLHSKPTPTPSPAPNTTQFLQPDSSPLYQKKPPGHSHTPLQPSNQLPFGAVTSAPYNSSTSPRPGYTTPPQPSSKLPFGATSSSYNPSPIPPKTGYYPPQPSNQLPFGAASSSFNSSLPRPQQQPFNSGNTPYNYQQQNQPNLGMRQQQQRQQDLRIKQQRLPPQQQQQRPVLMKQQQHQQRTRVIPNQQPTNRKNNPQQRQNKGEAGVDQQQEGVDQQQEGVDQQQEGVDQQQEGDDQQQQEGDQEVEDQTEDQAAQDIQDSYYDPNQGGDHYGQTDYSGGDDVSQQYYDDSSQYQQEDQFAQQDNNDYYQQPQNDYYYQQQTQDDYNQPQDPYQPQDNSYQQPQDNSYQQSQDIYGSQDMYNQDDSSYQPQDDSYQQPQDDSYQQPQDIYGSQDMYNQDDSSYQPQDDSYQQSQDIYGSQDMYQPEDNSYQEQPFEYNQQENPDQSGFFPDLKDNPVSGFFPNTNNNESSSVGGILNQVKNPVSKMKFFK
ncbi:5424_t:CDS:2 [Entrophospora sp. SA101]|nr:5424_t:CDS:2 [Entrophospora sp. SA101]CAJ0825976.1 21261_t:CDS:2 [Entrophospora sp. SA101]CAJ0832695.1 4740_t:CDS:2 [Entrophospora sp. SA101]